MICDLLLLLNTLKPSYKNTNGETLDEILNTSETIVFKNCFLKSHQK